MVHYLITHAAYPELSKETDVGKKTAGRICGPAAGGTGSM